MVRNHRPAYEVSIRGSLREQLPFETASFLGLLRASLDHRDGWAAGRGHATRNTAIAMSAIGSCADNYHPEEDS
jgi:hypothetical protein